jgi:hypothetical protein
MAEVSLMPYVESPSWKLFEKPGFSAWRERVRNRPSWKKVAAK